jgi:hypothetical protein
MSQYGDAGAEHHWHDHALRLEELDVTREWDVEDEGQDEPPCVGAGLRCYVLILSDEDEDLIGARPHESYQEACHSEHQHRPLLVDAEHVVLPGTEGLPTQRVQDARHASEEADVDMFVKPCHLTKLS